MADDQINYVKEVLKSDVNLAYVGVMVFLMLVVNFWGFLALLAAGQIGALFIAQDSRVQRIIRSRKNKDQQLEVEDKEKTIVQTLPASYQSDFHSMRGLCEEIERRSNELGEAENKGLLAGVIEKLSAFRYEYARMLQARHLLATRDYRSLQNSLSHELARAEKAMQAEQSQHVRQALAQNLNILKKRAERIQKLDELVRLLDARLLVIRNSLGLIQDEVYTFTNVAGISDLVDNLLDNLSLSEEYRSAYEDVLITEAAGASAREAPPLQAGLIDSFDKAAEPESPRRPDPREVIRRAK
jgi:hypothetical protein